MIMTSSSSLRRLPFMLLVWLQSSYLTMGVLRHDIPTCSDLFDQCIEDLEMAAAHKDHDHRDAFGIHDFMQFVHLHSSRTSGVELDDKITDIFCMAVDALNNSNSNQKHNDDCGMHNVHNMKIDLHDLFLFDGTELVKQMCREVQGMFELECLQSVKFVYTTEIATDSDIDCVREKLETITDAKLTGRLSSDHLTVLLNVEKYECLDSNATGMCTFVTNTVGCDGISEDDVKKDTVKEEIEKLINDDTEFMTITGGACSS